MIAAIIAGMRQHPGLLTMRILWFALLLASFLYVGMAFSGVIKAPPAPEVPLMPYALGAVSIIVAVLSFALPHSMLNAAMKADKIEITEEAAPNAFSERYREAMERRKVFANPTKAMRAAYARSMSPFILSLAFSEAISVFGLVLFMTGFDGKITIPFFVAGPLLIGIRFPTQPKILATLEKAHGASFP